MRRGAGAGARSAGALPQQLCELLRRPAGSSGASDGLHACSRLLAAGQQGRHHWPLTAAPWRPLAHRAARSGPARESWVRPLQIRPCVRQLQVRPLELCCRRLSSLPVRRRRGPAGPRAGRAARRVEEGEARASAGGTCQAGLRARVPVDRLVVRLCGVEPVALVLQRARFVQLRAAANRTLQCAAGAGS